MSDAPATGTRARPAGRGRVRLWVVALLVVILPIAYLAVRANEDVPMDASFAAFETLGLGPKPNQYLVLPAGFGAATPHRESPEFPVAAARLAASVRAVLAAAPRTRLLAESDDGLAFEAVQRSRLFRFPDRVSIRIVPRGEGRAALAIYSRSLIGYSDLGVNEGRIRDWLGRIEADLARGA